MINHEEMNPELSWSVASFEDDQIVDGGGESRIVDEHLLIEEDGEIRVVESHISSISGIDSILEEAIDREAWLKDWNYKEKISADFFVRLVRYGELGMAVLQHHHVLRLIIEH